MISSFVTLSRPTDAWQRSLTREVYKGTTSLRVSQDRLNMLLAADGIQCLHPKPNVERRTCGLWVTEEGLAVRSTEDRQELVQMGPDDLLYLPAGLGPNLELTDTCHVKLVTDPYELGVKSSAFARTGPLAGAFYRRSKSNPISVRQCPIEIDDDLDEARPQGWLNPIMLRVRLDGIAPANGGAGTIDAPTILGDLLAEQSLIVCEPEIGAELDGRVRFYGAYARLLRCRRGERSAFETLIWGQANGAARNGWRSFLGLDDLGGAFLILGHGRDPRICWRPTAEPSDGQLPQLPRNTLWLARRLAESWGGKVTEEMAGALRVPTWRVARRGSHPFLDSARVRPDQALAIRASWSEQIKLARGARGLSNYDDPQRLLTLYMRVAASLKLPPPPGLSRVTTTPSGLWLEYDEPGIKNALAERFLMPTSSVQIEIPAPSVELPRRFLDLGSCIAGGAREVARRWFSARRELITEEVELEVVFGWWNAWLELVFSHALQVKVSWVTSHSFILGESLLGEPLGEGAPVQRFDEMAF